MKYNLLFGTAGEFYDGYLNLNQFPFRPEEQKQDVRNLDNLMDDGEAFEILAYDVIDYLQANEVEPTIDHWVRKLAVGGKIVIGGVDIVDVAKALASYKIGIGEVNNLLYSGKPELPHMYKKTSVTANAIKEYLRDKHGLRINTVRVNGFNMVVEAEKV